jgi:glucan phosphoethanolaminetransferase (alkaline phosphatase superfamily)
MSPAEFLRVGVTCALIVLTLTTIVTQVFSTLLINRAAPVGESDIMGVLQKVSPALIVVGLLCGILAGGSMMFLAWKESRGVMSPAARILAAGGAMALGATSPLVTGVLNSLDPERMPQAGSPQAQWAVIFLTVAWVAWAVSGFQDRMRRIASGSWSLAAGRFDDCMAQVRLWRVAACIPALVLVAGLAGMFISAVETQFHTLDVAERITAFEGRYHIKEVDWVTDVDVLPVGKYWQVSLSGAWLVGAAHGLALSVVGLVVFGVFKWVRKRYKSPGLGATVLSLAGGIYVFAYARHGLAWVFEDEVIALGMFTLSNCGMAILGIIYGSLVAWNIMERCSRDDCPRDGKDMMRVILLSGILLATGPAARLGRRGCAVVRALAAAGLLVWGIAWAVDICGGPWEQIWEWIRAGIDGGPWLGLERYWVYLRLALALVLTVGVLAGFEGIVHVWRKLHARRSVLSDISAILAACTVAAVIVAVLFHASFPETEDHTTRVAIFLALVITLVAAYAACLLFPPRSRLWYVRSALIVVLLWFGAKSMVSAMTPTKDHSTIRNMMYEHSAVSKNNLECWRRVYGTGWKMPSPQAPVATPPDAPLDSPVLRRFRKDKPLVIFLIWDACRNDHMSFYGYRRKTTPRLDAMKDRLVRFDNAFSQATATSCSMRHVFTGRYSSRYMLKKTGIGPFFTNEMLAGGYHTMHLNIVGSDFNGISEVAFLRDMPEDLQIRVKVTQAGERLKDTLNQGDLKQWMSRVKRMRAEAGGLKPDRRVICYGEQKPAGKVNMLLDYLDNNQASGTFAYIHMTDSHYPWKRYDETYEWGDSHEDLYDGAIAHCDRATGRLFDGLKARGLLDKSIVIIAADHGTGLGDHGKYAGFHPYYEQIHIPLIMHVPGVKGKRISSLVGLFDIAPMLVSLAAPELIEARGYDAMDLWPLILRGERTAPRVIFGLNSFEDCYYRVGTDSLHYIWRRARGYDDLFDYVKDPHERTRKLLEDTETVNRCRAEMVWFLEQGEGRYLDPLHYRVEDPPDRH